MSHTPSARAAIITRRTYNRPLNEAGTVFESWAQTIDRCIGHQRWLWERASGHALTFGQGEELEELRELLLDRKVGLSGRTFWLGGTDIAKEREASQFNCSFLHVASVHDFVDMMWLLLNGVGVGFWPKPGSLNGFQVPTRDIIVRRSERTVAQWEAGERGAEANVETFDPSTRTWTIKVGDSAAGWAKAIGKLLAGKYPAKTLVLDFSEIRAGGIRLRGYGWISSGDANLAKAMEAIARIMSRKAGQLLSFANLHDIGNWCGTVLSTRRSAQIVMCNYGEPNWREFASFKSSMHETGNIQREQSNNSLVFWERPTQQQLGEIFDLMLAAGGSEPGFINGAAARARAPWFAGFNPCFAGDTLIATREGAFPIKSLVGKRADVWDGSAWRPVDNFRVTGTNQPLLKITMADGAELRVTPAHTMVLEDGTKVEASTLVAGDKLKLEDVQYDGEINETAAYFKGFLVGDGTNNGTGRAMLNLYEPKYSCMGRLIDSAEQEPIGEMRTSAIADVGFCEEHNGRKLMQGIACRPGLNEWCTEAKKRIPARVFAWNRASKVEFIAGLFDSDGTAMDSRNGFSYQISSIHKEFMLGLQTLLKSIGVRSTLGIMCPAGSREMPGGSYDCQESYRLSLGQADSVRLAKQVTFSRLVDFSGKRLAYNVKSRAGKIASIEFDSIADEVYCCTVEGTHTVTPAIGILTGQCVEILLADKGFCNLVNLNLGAFREDPAGLLRATYLISRANYRQTCVDLRDGVLQEAWHQNNTFLRLCGVSLTGQAMRPDLTPYDYRVIRNEAIAGAYSMAVELNMPRPKNVTCGKPEGTISKCMDATEGAHKPLAKYIFNNVAFGGHDPLLPLLRDAGYHVFEHPTRMGDYVAALPTACESVEFTRVGDLEVNLDGAVTQLEHYKMLMDNFIEQNQSVTISYDPSEVPAMIAWLHENWDHYVGVSFLLRAGPTKTAEDLGYPYLPQQPVSKATYDAYVSQLKPVDLDADTGDELLQIDDCSTGACPIR